MSLIYIIYVNLSTPPEKGMWIKFFSGAARLVKTSHAQVGKARVGFIRGGNTAFFYY